MNRYLKALTVLATMTVLIGYMVGLATYIDGLYAKRVKVLERDLRQYDVKGKELTQQAAAIEAARQSLAEQLAAEKDRMGQLEAVQETQAPLPIQYIAEQDDQTQAQALSSDESGTLNRLVDKLIELKTQSQPEYPKSTGYSGVEYDGSNGAVKVTSASGGGNTQTTVTTSGGAQTSTTQVTSASPTTTTAPKTTTTMAAATTTTAPPTTTSLRPATTTTLVTSAS